MASNEWYDDLDTGAIFWAGILSILIFVVSVLGIQAVYYAYNSYETGLRVAEGEPIHAIRELEAQRAELSTYHRYKEEDKTKIAIPIDKAMTIVAKELTESK